MEYKCYIYVGGITEEMETWIDFMQQFYFMDGAS